VIPIDLRGPRLRVRRAHPEDAAASFGWFADATVTRYLPLAGKSTLPLESIQSFLAQAASSDQPGIAVTFELEPQGSIGCGSFRHFEAGSAEVSIVIGVPDLWGRGLGAEALELLLTFGFGELGLASLWLIVRADNDRALELFRRFGFEVTEHQVAAVTIDGVARDKLKMQLSSTEYHPRVVAG
jgi:ribosomal-protein-alanine N-acetyltransferase